MARNRRSFPERTYKTNVMPGGLTYKISPMTMIIDQMRRDSRKTGVTTGDREQDIFTYEEEED